MQYITYQDIKDVDILEHFAERYGVKKRVIETLVQMCDVWGAPRTHEVLQMTQPLTYRQVRYIHRCVNLHNDLLHALKRGGSINDNGIMQRTEDGAVIGTYREIVFRKA